jgi:hypothetical protein
MTFQQLSDSYLELLGHFFSDHQLVQFRVVNKASAASTALLAAWFAEFYRIPDELDWPERLPDYSPLTPDAQVYANFRDHFDSPLTPDAQ